MSDCPQCGRPVEQERDHFDGFVRKWGCTPDAASRGRGWGKVYAQNREIRAAIDRGEHVHAVDVGKQRCWNGTRDCSVWSGQEDRDADRP